MPPSTPALPAPATASAAAPERFDMYGAIHKALRLFMHDTLARVGRLDPADADDMARALGQLDELLAELRHHVRNENDFVHTAIEARRPAGAARIGDEHVQHLAQIDALAHARHALGRAEASQRPALAQQLYRELALFVAENLEHMEREETQHNTLLWSLYSDAELVALHDRLLASLPPQEMAVVLCWLARALSPQELAGLCADMRGKLPPPAFGPLLAAVNAELDAPRRAKLAQALEAGAVADAVAA